MASANTNWVKIYLDAQTDKLDNAASHISKTGKQPSRNPKRFMLVGMYQCRQNFPYYTINGIVRSLYGKEVIIVSNDKISNFKSL